MISLRPSSPHPPRVIEPNACCSFEASARAISHYSSYTLSSADQTEDTKRPPDDDGELKVCGRLLATDDERASADEPSGSGAAPSPLASTEFRYAASAASIYERDWNKEMQRLLDLEESAEKSVLCCGKAPALCLIIRVCDLPDRYKRLSVFAREFYLVAACFGKVLAVGGPASCTFGSAHSLHPHPKIIIAEKNLPFEYKTIKPIRAGGQAGKARSVQAAARRNFHPSLHISLSLFSCFTSSVGLTAGGEKYLYRNIFFKFSIDCNGIYGSDECAMKAASHDLKGVINYMAAGVPGECALVVLLRASVSGRGRCDSLLTRADRSLRTQSSAHHAYRLSGLPPDRSLHSANFLLHAQIREC